MMSYCATTPADSTSMNWNSVGSDLDVCAGRSTAPRRRAECHPDRGAATSGVGTEQQAGVAVGIEPVALLDGMGISRLHGVKPTEGCHQHEQRRTRQVKIGQKDVNAAKAIARGDEDRSLAIERLDCAVLGGGAFQKPQRGGANRYDPAALGARRV